MESKTRELLNAATHARNEMRAGRMSRDEALPAVKAYLEHANKKGAEIAKRFGKKYHPISLHGFLR